MEVIVKDNHNEMSKEAFRLFADGLTGARALGFATGGTPRMLYELASEACSYGNISFRGKCSFNLDEYYPICRDDPESYWRYMYDNLFGRIDLESGKINFPHSMGSGQETTARYANLYKSLGPVDLQILGIGCNGHIGFNEPGSSRDSTIRIVRLSDDTIARNRPKTATAITMGIKEIMESRRIILIASGDDKGRAIRDAVKGRVTESVPASFLQEHGDVTIVLDRAAARML